MKPFTFHSCNLFLALRYHFKAEILILPVLSTLFLSISKWNFKVCTSKHAKNSVSSWCHSVTRFFVKARTCISYRAMSDSKVMDPCTLSSIQFLTESVLILSPCPSTPEFYQNLLFMPEPRTSLFLRDRSRSILSSVSRFLSGLRCFLEGHLALLLESMQRVLFFFSIVQYQTKIQGVISIRLPPL